MSLTNFAALTSAQKVVWSRDVWQAARDQMFIKKFTGSGDNSVIQRITELTKTEKGEQVLMHLVADLVDDGVIGDNEREGNEEAMQSYSQTLNIDLITHSVRNKGKLSDQKSIIKFRDEIVDPDRVFPLHDREGRARRRVGIEDQQPLPGAEAHLGDGRPGRIGGDARRLVAAQHVEGLRQPPRLTIPQSVVRC